MKLLGRNRLQPLFGIDTPTDAWLRGWIAEMASATWMKGHDVVKQFPRTKVLDTGSNFYFPVMNHPQQIEVAMVFPQSLALIVGIKRIH